MYGGCFLCLLLLWFVGSGVLVVAATDVDKSGASYYGEQSLHYLSVQGDGNMVPLGQQAHFVFLLLLATEAYKC